MQKCQTSSQRLLGSFQPLPTLGGLGGTNPGYDPPIRVGGWGRIAKRLGCVGFSPTPNFAWLGGVLSAAYIHMCPLLDTHTRINLYTYTYTYIHIHLHTYIYAYIHTYTHTFNHPYIHTNTHTYIHTYKHTHTHTHTHTYIHTS